MISSAANGAIECAESSGGLFCFECVDEDKPIYSGDECVACEDSSSSTALIVLVAVAVPILEIDHHHRHRNKPPSSGCHHPCHSCYHHVSRSNRNLLLQQGRMQRTRQEGGA